MQIVDKITAGGSYGETADFRISSDASTGAHFLNLDYSQILLENNVEAAVISNSTDKNREKLININKLEKGGLSGKPIEKISNIIINRFYKLIGKKIKIIGVGGTDSAEGVHEKILNGATLVQLYTGMVYKGPQIAAKINNELVKILEKDGIKNIGEIVG